MECPCYKAGNALKNLYCPFHDVRPGFKDSSEICLKCETKVYFKEISTCYKCKKERCKERCMEDEDYCIDCSKTVKRYSIFDEDFM
jgi:hypothetical protein